MDVAVLKVTGVQLPQPIIPHQVQLPILQLEIMVMVLIKLLHLQML